VQAIEIRPQLLALLGRGPAIRFEAVFAKINFAVASIQQPRLGRRDLARRQALLDPVTGRFLRTVDAGRVGALRHGRGQPHADEHGGCQKGSA